MTLKKKMQEMTAKFGFTPRGFITMAIAFPPAAVYVAWQWPEKSLMQRLVLCVLALAIPALVPILIGAPLYYAYSWITGAA